MDITSLFFYFFATILVLASLAVVFARNPLYNVLALVVVIFTMASLFIILEAFFVGIIVLTVYAGAVLIFFLFVVICLNLSNQPLAAVKQNQFWFLGGLVGVMFLSEFFFVTKSFLAVPAIENTSIRGTIEVVGKILFTDYLLPFELTSFLLLIAIFGIVSLAKGALSTGLDHTGDAAPLGGQQ